MHTRIAHISDLHLDEAFPQKHGISARDRFQQVLKDLQQEEIHEIVCTGDIGVQEGIGYFFEQISAFAFTIALGNHDSFVEVWPYCDQNTPHKDQKLYYATQREGHQCIYLDSSQDIIDNTQLLWLRQALVTPLPVIVFLHHPILGLSLKVDEIGRLKNRKEVLSLLTAAPNEITVFCGHYHMESSLHHQNVRQYITPAVSYQIEKKPDEIVIDTHCFAYRIITIKKHQVSSIIKTFSDANQKTIIH